jgi:hypothetical protein
MKTFVPLLFFAAIFWSTTARADSCTIGFDSAPAIFEIRPPQCTECSSLASAETWARNSFAYYPWYSDQPCGSLGKGFARPLVYPHFHLGYSNPAIQCLDKNGYFGFGPTSASFTDKCQPVSSPLSEPRTVSGHDSDEWIIVWASACQGCGKNAFVVSSFEIVSGTADIWFHGRERGWVHWPALSPKVWSAESVGFVDYVEFGSWGGNQITLDNVSIHN